MSRYIWNPEDENVNGGSDFYELSESGSASFGSSSYSNPQDEEVYLSQICRAYQSLKFDYDLAF